VACMADLLFFLNRPGLRGTHR